MHSFGLISRRGTPTVTGFYILHEGLMGVSKNTLQEISYDDIKEKGQVQETAKGIGQIADATTEQAQTATEVATGIQNGASLTENNASAAEEMSGSAKELSGQALQLKELVSAFKISSDA